MKRALESTAPPLIPSFTKTSALAFLELVLCSLILPTEVVNIIHDYTLVWINYHHRLRRNHAPGNWWQCTHRVTKNPCCFNYECHWCRQYISSCRIDMLGCETCYGDSPGEPGRPKRNVHGNWISFVRVCKGCVEKLLDRGDVTGHESRMRFRDCNDCQQQYNQSLALPINEENFTKELYTSQLTFY